MSLKSNKVTPLGVLGMRQLSFIPEHFSKTTIYDQTALDIQNIDWWISYTLNSRYAIRTLQPNNTIGSCAEIGFEDPKELLSFILGCPYLNKS